ncbi:MAG TPA: porin family protein [Cyclobacteriaceae bacterium]|nr:porin family protein [Cyclobacteriaceae bacterium]
MRKIKLLLVTICAMAGATAAYSQAEMAIGIKGGLNFATLNVSQSAGANYNNRTGYHAGAFALFKFGKIGLQPEILFSKQGTKYTFNSQDVDANFDYINIPIILKLYTVAGINLQLGPQIGFLSTAQAKSTVSGVSTTTDLKSFYNNNDISLAMGLGWDLPFGLSIEGRYNLGLKEINDGSNTNSTKNQVIMISAGYKLFKFGK